MASEYLKQKYKDVKPDVPRELTKAEKRRNWWDYHKWHVAAAVVLVLIAADLVWNVLGRGEPEPDYRIAYVGTVSLPSDTAAAVEAGLAGLGEDLNGDGQVVVQLRQYVSDPNGDASSVMAAGVQVMADISEQESFFFLLEDPEGFQLAYHVLSRLDGTLPEEEDFSVEGSVLAWDQCPVLAGLELGDYAYSLLGETVSGSSQELLSRLFIGRRGYWNEKEAGDLLTGNAALWDKLTAGAAS